MTGRMKLLQPQFETPKLYALLLETLKPHARLLESLKL